MLSSSLAAEKRFCHQLHTPRSVQWHSVLLEEFLSTKEPEVADYALLHDTPEGFLHDTTRMLKDDKRSAIEDAVYQAFRWVVNEPIDTELLETFKKYDTIASIVEAEFFGYPWPWVKETRDRYGDTVVDEYKEFVGDSRLDDYSAVHVWNSKIADLVKKYNLSLDERFDVTPELLEQIKHE